MAQTLTFKRTIGVPPAEVYRAFVHATALRDWLCDAAQTDARPGGRLYVWMRSEFYAAGEFVKLEPGKKETVARLPACSWASPFCMQ